VSPAAEGKYVLDTNLFIQAFRDEAANAELQRFHQLFAPFEYLSAVVAQELRAGTSNSRNGRRAAWVAT
jgi:predicted nucleic acid-binding protein